MATCGRGRPPIFQDHTCFLQLPNTESAFSLKISTNTPTLQDFTNGTDLDDKSIGSFARITVVAATLSRVASYTFQQRNSIDTKPPWDHSSDYSVLTSRLHWFAAYFETWMPISSAILTRCSNGNELDYSVSEPFIFAYVLYQLCHCLLQHPFLLRRQIQAFPTRYPISFFAVATKTGYEHAQELTRTLAFAKQSGHKAAASFLGYCSLVAASINGLYQYSADEEVRQQARSALATNVAFLKNHAVYWPNAAKMVVALDNYISKIWEYQSLIDVTRKSVQLSPPDVDYLYSIVDYGIMSTAEDIDQPHQSVGDLTTSLRNESAVPYSQGAYVDRAADSTETTRTSLFDGRMHIPDMSPLLNDAGFGSDSNFASTYPQYGPGLFLNF